LLVKTGHDLEDIGRTLSWSALGAFLRRPDVTSETCKDIEPEYASWAGTLKTNAILADIFDLLAMINANLCAMGSGKKAKKPKAYKRPGDNDKKKIGKNALPAAELREWFENKRKQHK